MRSECGYWMKRIGQLHAATTLPPEERDPGMEWRLDGILIRFERFVLGGISPRFLRRSILF